MGAAPRKEGALEPRGWAWGYMETEAQQNADVEMLGKQMDTQTCADQLSYSMKLKARKPEIYKMTLLLES